MYEALVQIALLLLPWKVRRRALQRFFGFRLHPSARIGRSLVLVRYLEMGAGAVIGHFDVIRGLDRLVMASSATIGRANWIYAIPSGSPHLAHEPQRRVELLIGTAGGMTSRHLIDCSNTVRIGNYSGLVGYHTQIITHQIGVQHCRLETQPVIIGDYCMVGTRSVLLGGSTLPDRSLLGAGSTLRNAFTTTDRLYSGVPAVATEKRFASDAAFFDANLRDAAQRDM